MRAGPRLSHNVASAREEPAPAFQIDTMDGKSVSLDSLAGKVVLVDFWATWCTYCRRDSDYVQSMLDSFPDGRFVLLEVDVDENRDQWLNYVKGNRLQGLQTRDASKDMQSAFHVKGFPTYVIFDANGTVRLRATGIEGDLRGTVRKLLAEDTGTPADATREKLPKASGQ